MCQLKSYLQHKIKVKNDHEINLCKSSDINPALKKSNPNNLNVFVGGAVLNLLLMTEFKCAINNNHPGLYS